jgi:hypothetical protein
LVYLRVRSGTDLMAAGVLGRVMTTSGSGLNGQYSRLG